MTLARVDDPLPTSNPDSGPYWDTGSIHKRLSSEGAVANLRATERLLEKTEWLPRPVKSFDVTDEQGRGLIQLVANALESKAKRKRQAVYFLQSSSRSALRLLVLNDGRLSRRWRFIDELAGRASKKPVSPDQLLTHLEILCGEKPALIFPVGDIARTCRDLVESNGGHQIHFDSGVQITLAMTAYREPSAIFDYPTFPRPHVNAEMTHLDRLEAESIHIIREIVAQAENPVMLYSVGKDSSVMLHLARKAFYPSVPPFPLMHVDTQWKFQTIYAFRDAIAQEVGMDLIVHINPDGIEKDINPFDHGSVLHTDVMKTQGLIQALHQHGFDVAFGGARRDEEKSRSKERVFSFRTQAHRWDPKNQRPELWNLYNGCKNKGEHIRVFPLSNWTELDIWQYIYREHIPVVPLYFSAERPVIKRDGMLIMVVDDRMRLLPDEEIETLRVRFRTLGCYPLTSAIESNADSPSSIILELLQGRTSERQGRAIDSNGPGSMEKKKQEGYF